MKRLSFPHPNPIHLPSKGDREKGQPRDRETEPSQPPPGPGDEGKGVWDPSPRPALAAKQPGLTCSAVLPKRFRESGCTSSRCRRRRTSCTSPRAAAPLNRSPARTSSSSMSTLAACEAPRGTRTQSVPGRPPMLAGSDLPRRNWPAQGSRPGSSAPGSRTTPTLQAGSSPLSASGSRGAGSRAQPSTAHKAQPGARPLGAGSRSNSPSLLLVGRGLF